MIRNEINTVLIAFNKPYGVVCQFSMHEKHPTLKSCISEKGFYPAGRLDTDSEGLMLLTNEGRLQQRITEPKFKLPKTYWAQVKGNINAKALGTLQSGVVLREFTTAPSQAVSIDPPDKLWPRTPPIRERKHIPTSWVAITVCEGKNRQVRRMCAAVGFSMPAPYSSANWAYSVV